MIKCWYQLTDGQTEKTADKAFQHAKKPKKLKGLQNQKDSGKDQEWDVSRLHLQKGPPVPHAPGTLWALVSVKTKITACAGNLTSVFQLRGS